MLSLLRALVLIITYLLSLLNALNIPDTLNILDIAIAVSQLIILYIVVVDGVLWLSVAIYFPSGLKASKLPGKVKISSQLFTFHILITFSLYLRRISPTKYFPSGLNLKDDSDSSSPSCNSIVLSSTLTTSPSSSPITLSSPFTKHPKSTAREVFPVPGGPENIKNLGLVYIPARIFLKVPSSM